MCSLIDRPLRARPANAAMYRIGPTPHGQESADVSSDTTNAAGGRRTRIAIGRAARFLND